MSSSKPFAFAIILFAFIACNSGKNNNDNSIDSTQLPLDSLSLTAAGRETLKIGNTTFFLDKSSEKEFLSAHSPSYDTSEIKNLRRDSASVKRNGDTLSFTISGGKKVFLVNNNSDDDSYAQYFYWGRLKDINQYLVMGNFYEWYNYILINGITGDTTILSGEPVISPGRRLLMTANSDLVAGFTFNGFGLFKIENNAVKPLGDRELSTWGPEEIRWLNDSVVLVQRTVADTSDITIQKKDFIKLTIRKN